MTQVSAAKKAEILALYKAGRGIAPIAKTLGTTRRAVRFTLDISGINITPGRRCVTGQRRALARTSIRPLLDELKRIRTDAGLTLTQVADLAGVSIGTISNIERGMTGARLDTFVDVANALGYVVKLERLKGAE